MAHDALFSPLKIGAVTAPNRVFMAPLTRNRAHPDGVPGEMAKTYYTQRASAGLIISEASQISAMGKGYMNTPGIHTDAQSDAWREIVDSVHKAGGLIAMQLWHVGRISHSSLLPGGAQPLAPSALRAKAKTFTEAGFLDTSQPRAMTQADIDQTIADYAAAAERAREAGFDLVEVHAANGYLIDQFLRDGSNKREDGYGGSIENRVRFLKEVMEAIADAIGADRVGVRLAPTGGFNDMCDSDPERLFLHAVKTLDPMGLAYLHGVEQIPGAAAGAAERAILDKVRAAWSGVYIANGDYTAETGAARITGKHADAVAYGRPFIANPDLPERFARNAPLNEADGSTFYGGGAEGYIDYPALDEAAA